MKDYGNDIFIHNAEVHSSAIIGSGTKIWNNVQIRENSVVGRDCILSKDVYIDEGVRVGDSCKFKTQYLCIKELL